MIHHAYKARSKRGAPEGAGVAYEQRKRLDFPAIFGARQTRCTVHSSAHQADAGRTDPADVAAVVDTQRPQLPCLCGHDHIRRLFSGPLGTDVLAGASLAFPFVMLVLQATNS